MSEAVGPQEADGAPAPAEAEANEIAELAEIVRAAAERMSRLWRTKRFDGDRTARLIEASRALHRAALALSDVDVIGLSEDSRAVAASPAGSRAQATSGLIAATRPAAFDGDGHRPLEDSGRATDAVARLRELSQMKDHFCFTVPVAGEERTA